MADVRYVGKFKGTMYGFNGFKKGVKPADLAISRGLVQPWSFGTTSD